jgi:hypothetical protein
MSNLNSILERVATSSDLGSNTYVLYDKIKDKKNSVFVDLGVRNGYSSAILSINSNDNNNKIYGIDVTFDDFIGEIVEKNNYFQIEGDSSSVGKYSEIEDLNNIDFLFIDTLHVREQVLCELYYWVPKLKNGAIIAFHDSHWPEEKKENIGNKIWERVDSAIVDFFGLSELKDFSNKNIEVSCYPDSWGMTFVKISNVEKFKNHIKDWNSVFEKRNELISVYWNSDSIKDKVIDLNLTP